MDEVAFELSQGGENAEDEPTGAARRVDLARENLEADVTGAQIGHELDDVGERTSDPVQLPHREGVTGAGDVESPGEPRPLGCTARAHVVVDALAARLLQRVTLQVEAGSGRPSIPACNR